MFLDSYRAHCSGNKDNIFLLVTGTDVHKHSEKMCKAVQEQGVTYVVLEEDTRSGFQKPAGTENTKAFTSRVAILLLQCPQLLL